MGTQTRTVVICGECGTDPETAQVDWKHLTDLFRAPVTGGATHTPFAIESMLRHRATNGLCLAHSVA
jgi:hypothetical protein